MELKDFVSESLKQIIKGVQLAQVFAQKDGRGAKINPRGITALKRDSKGCIQPHDIDTNLPVERIEFDVAVTASETSAASGGGGLRVWVINAGAETGKSAENTTVSRIRFGVPLVLPDPSVVGSDQHPLE